MDSEHTMKDVAAACAEAMRSADCDRYFLDELSSFPLNGTMLNSIAKWLPIPCSTVDSQALYTKCLASGSGSQIPAAEVSFPKDPNFYDKVLLKVKDLLNKLRVSTDDIALNIVFDRLLMYSKQHMMCSQSQVSPDHFATFILTLPNSDQQDGHRDEMVSILHADKENQFLVHALSNTHPTAALCFNDHAFILQKSSQDDIGIALVFYVLRQDAGCMDIPLMMFSKHNPAAASSLRRQITNWAVHTRPTDKQQLLIFPLHHMYAVDGLSFGMLKGSDANLWSAMAPQRHFLTYDLALVDDIKGESFLHSIPWNIDSKDEGRQLKGLNFFPECECVSTLPHPDSNEDEEMIDSDEPDQHTNHGLKLHRAVIVISIRHRFASIEAERRSGTASSFSVTSSVSSSHPMVLSASTTLSSEGGELLTPVQSLEQGFDPSLKHLATSVVTRMTDMNGAGMTAATAMDCFGTAASSSSSSWNGIYADHGNQPLPPQASSSSSSGTRFLSSSLFGGVPTYYSSRYYNGVENDDMKKSRSDPHRRLQFLRQRLEQRSIGRRYMMDEEGGGQQPRPFGAPLPPQVYPAPPPLPNRLERQNAAVGRALYDRPGRMPSQQQRPPQPSTSSRDWDDGSGFDFEAPRFGVDFVEPPRPSRRQVRLDRDDDERVDREDFTLSRRNMEADEHREAARLERDRQREQVRQQRRAQMEEARRQRNLERERAQQESIRRQQRSVDFFDVEDDDDNDTIDFNDFMSTYDLWESSHSINMFAASSSSTASAAMRSNMGAASAPAPAAPSWIPAALPAAPAAASASASIFSGTTRAGVQGVSLSDNPIPIGVSRYNGSNVRASYLAASSSASAARQPASMDSRIADAHQRVEEARTTARQRVEELRASSQQRETEARASAQQRVAEAQASSQQREAEAWARRRVEQTQTSTSTSARISLEELMGLRSSSPFWEIPTFPLPSAATISDVILEEDDIFNDNWMNLWQPPAPQAPERAVVAAPAAVAAAPVQRAVVPPPAPTSTSTKNAAFVHELPSRRKRSVTEILHEEQQQQQPADSLLSSGLRRSRRTRGSQQQG